MRVHWIAVCFALVLSGCYVSKQPFVTPDTADYPFATGTRFDVARPSGKEWRRQPARTLHRVGTHYVYVEDGSPRRSVPFLIKQIAPRRYIVQLNDSSDPKKVTEHYYALLDFDGTTAIQYQPACLPRQTWIDRKWIDKVERVSMGDRCLFTSMQNLTSVLQDAAVKAAPEMRFTLVRATPAR